MDNLLTISLDAHNADRNHHRRYEIRLGRDLFGDWTVCLLYGRVGRAGQLVRHSGADPERLRQVIQASLRRRLSAPKRIGCAYRLSGLSTADGIDVAFWLSGDALACFCEEGGWSIPPADLAGAGWRYASGQSVVYSSSSSSECASLCSGTGGPMISGSPLMISPW